MFTNNTKLLTLAIGAALGLAGCGGGGDSATPSTSSTPTPSSDPCLNIDGVQSTLDPSVSTASPGHCLINGAEPAAAAVFEANGVNPMAYRLLDLINAEYAYARGITGQGVSLTIHESRVKQTHEQFVGGKIVKAVGEFLFFPYIHANPVASIAAGWTMGVAKDAFIYNIDDGGLNHSPIYSKILNASHAVTEFDAQNLTADIVANDTLLVQSSGNSNRELDVAYPGMTGNAAYPPFAPGIKERFIFAGQIPTDVPDNPGIGNYPGDNVTYQETFITAPTCGAIAASGEDGDTDFSYMVVCGTSFAAPAVSGAAALIKQARPDFTAGQIREVLLKSANRSFTTEYQHNDCGANKTTNCGLYYFGQGMLDIEGALKMAGVD